MRTVVICFVCALLSGCSTVETGGLPRQDVAGGAPTALAASRESRVNFVLTGIVIKVEDGDTLTMQGPGGGKFDIRMSDIDTPEISHAKNPYKDRRDKEYRVGCPSGPAKAPGQPYGRAAADSLAKLMPINAPARAECYESDLYGRWVCHVFVGAVNVNLEQINRGWAMTPSNPNWVRDPASKPAESAAKAAGIGMWRLANPISPDTWRKGCWCEGRCQGAE